FQSLMELGERICLPRPECLSCPIRHDCAGRKNGSAEKLPAGSEKKKTQQIYWYFLLINRKDTHYYIQNPQRAFLKSAWLFPDLLSVGKLEPEGLRKAFSEQWGVELDEIQETGQIRHSVTFRKIEGHILTARQFRFATEHGKWLTEAELVNYQISSVVKK